MKLKQKIHLWSSLLMLVILGVLTAVIYFSFSELAYDREISQLQTELEALVTAVNEKSVDDPTSILRGYVPADGLVRATFGNAEPVPAIQVQDPDVAESRFAYVTAPVIWTDGEVAELAMAQSMDEVAANLQSFRFVLLGSIAVAMIPIILSSVVLGRLVTKPVTDLTNTMTRIQKSGQFEKLPITQTSKDEIGEMGSTFNEMMKLLEENYRKQEEFVSNASHELKTPLTAISSYAKLLQRQGTGDAAIAEESLAAIRMETERMNSLIE